MHWLNMSHNIIFYSDQLEIRLSVHIQITVVTVESTYKHVLIDRRSVWTLRMNDFEMMYFKKDIDQSSWTHER